ncbi:MAG: PLP-dependent aminotransferase family protein [Bacillota bacterium]
MQLHVDRRGAAPLYQQIAQAIMEQVRLGRLRPGDRLPPTRDLADQLEVTRSTVVAAYQELEERGWVTSHVGKGTFIQGRPTEGRTAAAAADDTPPAGEASGTRLVTREELRRLVRMMDRPGLISLASGIPALDAFPVERLRRALDLVLKRQGAAALQYDSPEGYWPLRERIAAYLGGLGAVVHPAEVLITSGTQQGATLVARVLLRPGDVVLLDQPTYAGALDAFEAAGALTMGVPADSDGILPDALDDLARRLRPRLLYLVPACQGPAAHQLPADRRRRVLDVARQRGFTVVEDDSFRELRYVGQPESPLKALDEAGQVIHLGSFSKTLAPGLRVGYVVAGGAWLEDLAEAKQTADLHTSTLIQRAVDAYLDSGDMEAQLSRTREVSGQRRQAMLAALRQRLPEEVEWWEPEAGPFLWLRLPPDVTAVAAYVSALEHGVAFAIGAGFFPDRLDRGLARLNFAALPPDQIETAVARLTEAMASLGLGTEGSNSRGGPAGLRRTGPTVL